jgi:hypothetical protein
MIGLGDPSTNVATNSGGSAGFSLGGDLLRYLSRDFLVYIRQVNAGIG